jgi:alpha-N-arabinofuranosidase
MDGPWQIGHTSAADYGRRAAEAGKAMRMVDPSIELVACGSSFRQMPTFGAWEATVAELTMDVADYLSMHAYYDGRQDRRDFLASGHRLAAFIADVLTTCDAASARLNSARRLQISLDEWNVWSSAAGASPVGRTRDISHAPRITEDPYQALDAVVVGDLIVSILNHADRVRIACLSLLVNVSAPIVTEPGGAAYRQATFHPFAAAAALARGEALMTRVRAPEYRTPTHGVLPSVAAAVTYAPAAGAAAMFLTNRAAEPVECTISHGGFERFDLTSVRALCATDAREPRELGLLPVGEVQTGRRVSTVVLPGESWTAVEIAA